ncbi:hypothetical protein LX15_003750 [Streptoalloteichus tenebrarius]|uniref:Uncharacterized protein n=1 Tax=Streptoalloteichus tenebrarius (strain ATCC 17920 / DSM 40477 / JCM 4838 / CBS 697.72 / NBRC 16177 / NCIMB 11028 / NRRL B-12390 / A12253. 1 / ISP 5477) TaxID=1933 RepID=A0ABT1HWZ8_STRSD|nr:hypothetical protein [Streptoalloteichus tenebrarius]BFF03842.1 hypothetical protein GCM10020241_55170 [Streptoalloteichus tenebrarius]
MVRLTGVGASSVVVGVPRSPVTTGAGGWRREFRGAVAVFGSASLVAGVSAQPLVLATARTVQGVGVVVAVTALLRSARTDPVRWMSITTAWGRTPPLGLSAGTPLSGAAVAVLSSRWAFLVPAVAAGVAWMAAPRLLRDPTTTPTGTGFGASPLVGALSLLGLLPIAAHVARVTTLPAVTGVVLFLIFLPVVVGRGFPPGNPPPAPTVPGLPSVTDVAAPGRRRAGGRGSFVPSGLTARALTRGVGCHRGRRDN